MRNMDNANNTAAAETEAVRLTRAEIKRRYDALDQVEKDLTARLVAMHRAPATGELVILSATAPAKSTPWPSEL